MPALHDSMVSLTPTNSNNGKDIQATTAANAQFYYHREMPPGKREDGFKAPMISVADLSLDEAKKYGELMREEFIRHWNSKQQHKTTPEALKRMINAK